MVFFEIVNEFKRKPNKLCGDQGENFIISPMRKWLDDNNTLICSTNNEAKSVVTKRFMKTFKGKICKKMTPNSSKSYLSCQTKLIDKVNNTYQSSIGKNPINADYFALTEKIESIHKSPKIKFGDRFRITKYKNIFSKSQTKNLS